MRPADAGSPVMRSFTYEFDVFVHRHLRNDLESSRRNVPRTRRPIDGQRPRLRRRAAGATVEVPRGDAPGSQRRRPQWEMPPRTPAACGHTRLDRRYAVNRPACAVRHTGSIAGTGRLSAALAGRRGNPVAVHPSDENPGASNGPYHRRPGDPRERATPTDRPNGRSTSLPRPTPPQSRTPGQRSGRVRPPESRCS